MELILRLLRTGEARVVIDACRGECRHNGREWYCHLYDGQHAHEGFSKSRGAAIRKASEAYIKAMGWAVPA